MVHGRAGSGLSIRVWCRRHALREPTFYWWRTELTRRDRGRRHRKIKPAPSFVPVHLATASAPAESTGAEGRIEIVLPGDRRVQVIGRVNRETLDTVLAALETTPC